jgi:hypothetical protein
MASTAYSKSTHFTVDGIASRLIAFTRASAHAYWPDDISILDAGRFNHAIILLSNCGFQVHDRSRVTPLSS